MLPGETHDAAVAVACSDCHALLKLKVCRSNAYYIGYWCSTCCAPYARETDYFKDEAEAQAALDKFNETGVLDKKRY